MVAAGTGETLPGPVVCGMAAGASRLITSDELGNGRVPGGSRRRPYYCLNPRDNKTWGEGRAAASFTRHV